MNGLIQIDPMEMPITSGLLASQNSNFTGAGMSRDPLSGGFFSALQNNPSATLALGAGLLQASEAGMGLGGGVGYGLQAFSQSLAQAEQQKQQNRLAQLKAMELESKIRKQMMGGFEGTGMSAQMANMQAQRYMQQGYSPQEAYYRAGREVMASMPVTTTDPATGALIQMNRNPVPYVGGGADPINTPMLQPGQVLQAPSAPASAPPADFMQAMNTPVIPQAGEADFLSTVTGQAPLPQGMMQPAASGLTPIEQRTKSIRETDQAVDRMKELRTDAAAASDALPQAETAIQVLQSGFPGGMRSELLARYQNIVGKSNQTPEEQKFLQDYAVLERYAGNQTLDLAQKLKPLSDSDLAFAKAMAGQPSQNPEVLRTKIMVDYATNQRRIEKAQYAAQWENQYGSLAKRDPQGNTFDDFIKEQLGGPLITPDLAARFGAMFYVNSADELEAMNLPPGTKAFDMKTKKMLVVE